MINRFCLANSEYRFGSINAVTDHMYLAYSFYYQTFIIADRGRNETMLKLFKKKEDSKEKPVCNYCNAVFPDKEHLEKHKKIAHAKGR